MSEPTAAPLAEPVAQDIKKDAPLDENGQPLSKGEIKRREKEAASECWILEERSEADRSL
jgi:hypothetical protein